MTTSLDEMTLGQMSPKKKPDPTAEEVAAVELIRLAKEAGLVRGGHCRAWLGRTSSAGLRVTPAYGTRRRVALVGVTVAPGWAGRRAVGSRG